MRVTITNNTCQKIDTIVVKYANNCGRAQGTPLGHLGVKNTLKNEQSLYYPLVLPLSANRAYIITNQNCLLLQHRFFGRWYIFGVLLGPSVMEKLVFAETFS